MSDNKLSQTPLAATVAKGQISGSERDVILREQNHQTRQPLREGSTLYYASLRMNENHRLRALQAIELTHTLSNCLTGVQEAQVAQTKLQWWSDEINRLALNEPRHPSTKNCQEFLGGDERAKIHLTTVLDAATAARFDAPEDDQRWQELVQQDYAARLSILYRAVTKGAINQSVDGTFESASDLNTLGLSVAWIDLLSTLPSRIHQDQIAFPPSMYEQFNLTRTDLLKLLRVAGHNDSARQTADTKKISSAAEKLIQAAVNQAHMAGNDAIQSLMYKQLAANSASRGFTIWLQLRQAQLQLWQKNKPNLLRETMTLTPIRKWYIAFRHR